MKIKIKCLDSQINDKLGAWVTEGKVYDFWRGEKGWWYIISNFGEEEWVIEPNEEDNHIWFQSTFKLPDGWTFGKVLNMTIHKEDSFEDAYDRAMGII